MIELHHHHDVIRLRMSHARSRLVGMSVSAYLVRGVLIDSGFPAIGRALERWIRDAGPLRGALLTHAHEDHAGNAPLLARLGVPTGMGAATLEALRHPAPLALYRRFTWGVPRPLTAEVTPFTDAELRLVHTPGHAEDHHVVWDAREGTLFAGDLFLGVRASFMHAHERPRELVRSLRMVAALEPVRLFDSHRGPVSDPGRALAARIAWLEETIGRIEALVARGWSDGAIQREVLGRDRAMDLFTQGEYTRRNFVRAVRGERPPAPADRQSPDR